MGSHRSLLVLGLASLMTSCTTMRSQSHGFTAEQLWTSQHSHRRSFSEIAQPSQYDVAHYAQELDHKIATYLREHPTIQDSIRHHLKTHRITDGMLKEHVTLLCGVPDSVRRTKGQEVWGYHLFPPATYQLYFQDNVLVLIEWTSKEPF